MEGFFGRADMAVLAGLAQCGSTGGLGEEKVQSRRLLGTLDRTKSTVGKAAVTAGTQDSPKAIYGR